MLERTTHKSAPQELVNALVCLYNEGKIEEVYTRSLPLIREYPDTSAIHNIMGAISYQKGDKGSAIEYFRKVIELNPDHPHAYNNLGATLVDLEEYEEAKKVIGEAIHLQPDYAEAYNNLGNVHKELEEYDQAIAQYEKAIELNPRYYEAYNNLGVALGKNEQYEEAAEVLKNTIHMKPEFAEAYNTLGAILTDWEKYEEAKQALLEAISIAPDNAKAYNNLGNAYERLDEYDQAIVQYEKAVELNPQYYQAYNNLGAALSNIEKYEEAQKVLKQAIQINSKFAESYHNMGLIFRLTGNYDEAIKHQRMAVSLKPEDENNFQVLLFSLNYSPDMSAEEIYDYYRQYDQKFGLPLKSKWKPFAQTKAPKNKLRIGYVSPDFKEHSMRNFLEPVLTHHNHDKFEIYAFAELKKEDQITQKYKSYADHWIRTDKMSDEEMAQKIRDVQIDILIDLAGHTKGNRLGVFALKPAPVSLSWWIGYGYTTGLSAIDYFLTDNVLAPEGSEHLFAEQLCRLNQYSVCYQKKIGMGSINPLPALTNGFITFGTLTRVIRINDKVIKAWSQILNQVKGSKLIINSKSFNNSMTINEFKQKFQEYGISSDRLDIYYQSPPWDTMRKIDIALDCFPHNSGTTLNEHLYMGNPFITMAGRPSVGRIGASILDTLGHPEWIATSEEAYIDKAIALASDTKKLAKIRGSLRAEIEASPIMDTRGFVEGLEKIYQGMWEKWCAS